MCGIVGYVGSRSFKKIVLDGLTSLEYRGYDSAGVVALDNRTGKLAFQKEAYGVGSIKQLYDTVKFDGSVGVGHTRWATHGVIEQKNAHPHFNCEGTVAVVHNGIIENYEGLREQLLAENHELYSSTDTEIVAHLFSSLLKKHGTLKAAAQQLVKKIQGAFAFVFLCEQYPDELLLIRYRSPLVVGLGNNEMFVASDYTAFSHMTSTVSFLPDSSFAILRKDAFEVYDFNGAVLTPRIESVDRKYNAIDKQGFEHYMLKEIYEQKRAIMRTIRFCKIIGSNRSVLVDDYDSLYRTKELEVDNNDSIWRQLGLTKDAVKSLKTINLVAAGTSWHASRIAQFFFEIIAKIPTQVYLASEFRYMPFFPKEDSVYIMISQSGETADTLEALRLVNAYELPTVVLTNVASSTMVREAGGFLPMQAGPEISVASTKAFSTQMATLFWLANRVALERHTISQHEANTAEEDLFVAAEILETSIEDYKVAITTTLAEKYARYDRFIFLGRHINYPFAMEAALKLKEISYIFSQCYPAGELKHGPIALIDEKTPVVLFSSLDELLYWKIYSNAQEVKARKGHLVIFAFEGQDELMKLADTLFVIPRVNPLLAPLAMTGLMQFFVYHVTRALGRPIDKPRNLAKAVTVE